MKKNKTVKQKGKLMPNAVLDEVGRAAGKEAPYRCPICGGNGLVSGAFYTSLLGCRGTSTNITE